METQYDLNIWNFGWHNAERNEYGEHEYTDENSQWRISVHELEYATDGMVQCGKWIEGLHLDLTPEEAVRLTLGWGGDDEIIGDYSRDTDFFLDSDVFFDIYKDIPQRVADFIHALPPYTMKDWRN